MKKIIHILNHIEYLTDESTNEYKRVTNTAEYAVTE